MPLTEEDNCIFGILLSPFYWHLWDRNITQKRGSKLVFKASEGAVPATGYEGIEALIL